MNHTEDVYAAIATQVKATVKSKVKYRLFLARWNWEVAYSRNDLRVYMERGTAHEKFVDVKFETILDNGVVIGRHEEYGWEMNFEAGGREYLDVEFVASASKQTTPYYGFLMTELHYLINGDGYMTDDFFEKTPLRAFNYPDSPALMFSDQIDDKSPNGNMYGTYHAYARLRSGVSYRFMVRNTGNRYETPSQMYITVYVERGTPYEQEYYMSFTTEGD